MNQKNHTIRITKNITVIITKLSSGIISVRCNIDADKNSPVGCNIFVGELIHSGYWKSSDRKTGQRLFFHLWNYKRIEFSNAVQSLLSAK